MNFLLSLFFLLSFSTISNGQLEYTNQKFKTNVLIGNPDLSGRDKKVLYFDILDNKEPWGNFLVLNSDGTFQSHNQNKCGNDCRIKIKGIYTINGTNIEFSIVEVKFMDICATQPPIRKSTSFGKYDFTSENGRILLRKVD